MWVQRFDTLKLPLQASSGMTWPGWEYHLVILRFIVISVPMRMLLRWFYAVMFSSQCSNEDAVKMILCNVFKPSPAGYPLMLRESIWSSFVPEFVRRWLFVIRKEWFEPVNVDLAQTGAASPGASRIRLGASISTISTASNPSPGPTWKAWPESRPSQGPRLSRGEKWEQNKSKRATHSWLIARDPVLSLLTAACQPDKGSIQLLESICSTPDSRCEFMEFLLQNVCFQ